MGYVFLNYLKISGYREEMPLFAFLCGSAFLSLTMFLLCLFKLVYVGVLIGIGAISVAGAFRVRRREVDKRLPALPKAWLALFFVVFASLLLMYFCNALAPEVSPDGSGYHLGNVIRIWRNHGFDWNYHSLYSYFPQGMEMLFLAAFAFGGHSAAALVHLVFFTILPLLMVCYGRRFGFAEAGIFAAILVYASPVAAITGVSAYNDLAVATVVYAVFYWLQVWDELKQDNLLILIGLLSGYGFAIKYTAGLMLPFAAIWVAWKGRIRYATQPRASAARAAASLLLPAVLMAVPWLIRNWVWVGNPAAPFLNRWFPNPYYSAAAERAYLADVGHYEPLAHWWEYPLQFTIYGAKIPGFLGPVFLLAPLALLGLRSRHGRRLLAAAAVFAIPVFFNASSRFLLSSMPFLSLAMGIAISSSWGALPALAIFHAILSCPAMMPLYSAPWAWRIREIPIRAALRNEPDSAFLRRRLSGYSLKAPIEKWVPAGELIFSFAGRPEAYIDREIVVGYESALGIRVRAGLWAVASESRSGSRIEATRNMKALGIRYLLIGEGDLPAEDMKQNSNLWGITLLAEVDGTRLYRID
jgi:hypothetical protein